MKKQAVLSLSGGMDSSTVLLHLLAKGYEVTAVSFDYGQKHKVELERAQDLVNYINLSRINESNINYKTIKLDGLVKLLNSKKEFWQSAAWREYCHVLLKFKILRT